MPCPPVASRDRMITGRSVSCATVARRLLSMPGFGPIRVGRLVLAWTLALASLASAGCLVTEIKEYEADPNEPPFIVYPATGTSPPLNDVVEVPLDELPPTMTELTFSVEIYDRNVNQPLSLRRVVNRPTVGDFLLLDLPVPANGERIRTATFRVPFGLLTQRCNRVEAFVSSSFLAGVEPEEPGDLAGAAWSVLAYRGAQSVTLPLNCGAGGAGP